MTTTSSIDPSLTPRASMKRARAPQSPRAPREHGFWVMLALTVVAGLGLAPSWLGLAVALAVFAGAMIGAAWIGKRIRKNPSLQVGSSMLLGMAAAPIALTGGAAAASAWLLALGLGTAFTAGALSVNSVLLRARRRPAQADATGWCGFALPVTLSASFLLMGHPCKALALGITALYALTLLLLQPSAKALKRIGLTISAAHATTALLLI